MHTHPCRLLLEDGTCYEGRAPSWQQGSVAAEAVFSTGMVGYAESLTDPSFAGQILVFTYPLIGNYGVPSATKWESSRLQVAGVVVSEACMRWSHHAGQRSLTDWLADEGVWLMTGVDTRALTLHLRRQGTAPAMMTSDVAPSKPFVDYGTEHWVSKVSVAEPEVLSHGSKRVILVDCGMKDSIARHLSQYDLTLVRVPHDYDYCDEEWDAVFVSNGPGDPSHCSATVHILRRAMERKKPIFGICLGTQLMALAAGAKTYRLPFGHRGQNQPCLEVDTGRCYLTSQNHGYAIDADSLPEGWKVSYRNLNDDTVEGIAHETLPFAAVQFHPEAAPGPVDTNHLFQRFYEML